MREKNVNVNDSELIDKERQVLKYRQGGLTFDRIAELMGYSHPSGAHAAFQRAIQRIKDDALAEDGRALHRARLEAALTAIWDKVLKGDLRAIDRMLKILSRDAKLHGLDMPIQIKQDITIVDEGELNEQVRRFAYLVAEARVNSIGHTNGQPIVLGSDSAGESDTANGQLADLVNPIGSRMGQDSNGRGVDSVASSEQPEDTVGGSS
jgi:hypothetical protein